MLKKHVRPWGYYQIILSNNYTKVKKIVVKPKQRLSYQYHNNRQECWVIIKGKLTIVLDDDKIFRSYGESVRIPKGSKHRAWNETDKNVEFIEIQTGTYFGEDDIVRVQDDYSRH